MLITQRVVIDVSEKLLKHLKENTEEAAETLSQLNLEMDTVIEKYDPKSENYPVNRNNQIASQDEWDDADFDVEEDEDGPDID